MSLLFPPSDDAPFFEMGKQAATSSPELSYGLAGRLYLSQSGWLLLSVPNAIMRGAFDALHEHGTELPPGKEGRPPNAHISVMNAEEVEEIGGPDKITERGQVFRYTLGPVREVNPAGWEEMERCWFMEARSPELSNLRKSYGLSALPNKGKFKFHITFAVRRKGVLRENDVVKQSEFLSILGYPVWDKEAAETLPVPNVRQGRPYTCGDASLEAVSQAYGGKPESEDELERDMGTTPDDGTSPTAIAAEAKKLGLESKLISPMSIAQLTEAIDAGKTVICAIQAWGDTANYPKLEEGHYVVATGHDADNIYFEDPASDAGEAFIPRDEFLSRWADKDGQGKEWRQLGIVAWKPGHELEKETSSTPEKLAGHRLQSINPDHPLSPEMQQMAAILSFLLHAKQHKDRPRDADAEKNAAAYISQVLFV